MNQRSAIFGDLVDFCKAFASGQPGFSPAGIALAGLQSQYTWGFLLETVRSFQ
jgi:hypothetical protein